MFYGTLKVVERNWESERHVILMLIIIRLLILKKYPKKDKTSNNIY